MKPKVLSLDFIWKIRLQLRANGRKLLFEGDDLRDEGERLEIEGNKLWAEAILEAYGNIRMEWVEWDNKSQDYKCKLFLTNGEIEIYG